MNLLILSATEGEVSILKDHLQKTPGTQHNITMVVAGVGVIATTFALTRELSTHKYDMVIQAGVGGSFDENIQLGEVVQVISERYGDLGAEDHDKYIDIFEMGLIEPDVQPHTHKILGTIPNAITDNTGLKKVTGLTVNTVSGNEQTIARRKELFHCQVESMEGTAFHYVCLQMGVPFMQVRGISNYVIPRDKSKWQMKDAIINLNNWLINFLENAE
ncbi:futalosine hydrolase [Flavipsychrobacter stenotrophus]|uniref:Futalosine hydrolase n=1 Tax=Flavipsychrobacter stenotrophus TaxID=2077091 RepID=A0A2S7SY01_9BACT|nr:futalosine hydrolase [Flavipsychrobacter stenotrophus]PQJ11792.1 futalosine hydrolase [Flavipsychrobacter stenotrophus]